MEWVYLNNTKWKYPVNYRYSKYVLQIDMLGLIVNIS